MKIQFIDNIINQATANVPPYLRPLVIPAYTEVILFISTIIISIFFFTWTRLVIMLLLNIIELYCIIRIYEKITGEKTTWK